MNKENEIICDVVEVDSNPYESRQIAITTPADLMRIAIERGTDIAQLEKLMDLQERYEANLAHKAFVASMTQFKKNAPKIYKDSKVEHSGISYNHAKLGNICEAVIPCLSDNGISHSWSQIQPDNGMIQVTCTLTHSLGHSESNTMQAPPDATGKKNTIQAIASTISYLQRYTFLAAIGLATNDIDNDGRETEIEKEEKKIERKTLSSKSFDKALESVLSQTYTKSDILLNYILTTDQEIAIDDAVKSLKDEK